MSFSISIWLISQYPPNISMLSKMKIPLFFYSWVVFHCICMYVCVYIYICIYVYTHIYTYMYIYVIQNENSIIFYSWVVFHCIYMYVCVYMYMYICIHTHTHTYIYIHTHPFIFIHSLADEHLGCFHISAIVNDAATNIAIHVSSQISFFIFIFKFFSDIYQGVELLGHMVVLFWILWETSILLSLVPASIYIPTKSMRGFSFLHIFANIC